MGTDTHNPDLVSAKESDLTIGLRHCLNCGVLAVADGGRITFFNEAAARLARMTAQGLQTASLDVLPTQLQEAIRETFASGTGIAERFVALPTAGANGHALMVATAISPASAKMPRQVVVTLTDLAAVKKLETSMQQLDRLASIGTLCASMAHEVKNALVAVKTFVDLLLAANMDSELASLVSKEIKRIDSILSQILRFAGPAKPTFSQIHVHEILDHSLRLVQHQQEKKQINLVRSYEADEDNILGDFYQLEQAFLNLLFNAIEATAVHGEIRIKTDLIASNSDQPQLRIAIADNGSGIGSDDLLRLFEPFFTTKPNGTGLGLPITRRIVQEHRGEIEVESEPGTGTTFRLLLPLSQKSRSPI